MRIVTEGDQCVCDEEAVNTRVTVLNFSLEGKSIHLEPRVRDDPHKKTQKSNSPQQLRIDLQREQGIQLPKKAGRAKKSKRRLSDQRKSVREVVLARRPSAAPRTLIPPRTPLVMSKMSMPTEGQKFSDSDNAVVMNTSEEASNVMKRLMGTNSVVEESTSTKKVTKQTAVKGNVSSIRGQVLHQQNSLDNMQESNNNRALSEINSNNQVVNTSQKTVSSTSSTTSTKTTRRESYSTQTHVQESFSSSYEDVEDNSGVAAICSPDQIKAATNVSKTSKTSQQVKEVRQSTLQSTSSIDSDISSVDEGAKKVKKEQSSVQTVDTQVQKTKDTEKIVAENVDYTEQTKTMSVEEFQKIRTIKEFIHIQKKLKNAEDNDTEEEEEEDYESEKIMSVDDIRKKLAENPPKEVINDTTKKEQIVKGSRIEEIRTTTKRIYPNPDNGDQPVEQETVTVERKVVPAGTTIMSNTENTENTQKKVVATQETAVKKSTKTESQQVKQTKTKTTESGTHEVVQQDTAVQNVQNVQNVNKQNVQNVQALQTVQTENVQNVQQVQKNVQNVQQVQQNVQNVQQVQQNVQTQNVQQVQQNTQKVVETQNVQQKIQDVQSQNVQQNTQNVQTQNVQQNTNNQQTTTQNTDKSQQTQSMTLEEFQNIRKIKEYITTERKMLNPEDNFVEEEGETSFEAEIIMTLDDIRKRINTQPPKETVKDTTKNAPIPPGSKILEIRTITRTVLPNPDKNDEKVEQVTVLLERTVVPAGTPLIPNAENIPQKKVVTAGQETAVKKTTSTESQQVQQTKTQVTQTGTTDTQNIAQNKNVQNTQNIQNQQNIQNTQSQQNVQNTQNIQNVQTTNIQSTNVQETQRNVQGTQNVQNIQNEALKTSVNSIKKTTLTSTSSIDSDTSSLDEASRLNQNTQLVDANQTVGGASVVKQTSSKTTKVTETRKIIKQSSTGAPETFVEEAAKTQSSETVVNATCGADGKFNVEENTKSSTTVSSGVGNEEEMKRQIQSQNKNLTKKLVSDGVTVVADVDQFREKVVQQQEGANVTFKQTTTDSKHKRMVEDASKFEHPALALAAVPSPDSQPGSASPQLEMPSFQQNK